MVPPYYKGHCFPLCDTCPSADAVGTPLYKTELQRGVNVLSGDGGSRNIFAQNAFSVVNKTSSATHRVAADARDMLAVRDMISNEFGWDASAGLSGKAKFGVVSANATATFAGSTVYKAAQSAIQKNSRSFSWIRRRFFLFEAFVSNYSELDPGFKAAVAALSATDSYSTFKALFERYGTHYASSANIGASLDVYMTTSSSFAALASTEFREKCFEWAVAAGLAFDGLLGGAFDVWLSGSYGEGKCEGTRNSETASTFFEQAEIRQHAKGGRVEMLSCGYPTWRFDNYTDGACLHEGNAEVFPNELRPIWDLFQDAAPQLSLEVRDAAEFYFLKYMTEEGTLVDGTRNPDQLRESYMDWVGSETFEDIEEGRLFVSVSRADVGDAGCGLLPRIAIAAGMLLAVVQEL